jgi:hypothetical protein
MPSRNPGRSATTKPRITSRHTEAVVVTRGVLRGLVWLELLPRCCPPNDGELHVPRCGTTRPEDEEPDPRIPLGAGHGLLEGPGDRRPGRASRTPRPRRGSTTGARGDPEGRADWSACKSTRERRRTHRVSRRLIYMSARRSGQGDRNSEVPMPIAQAGARRTLPVSPMNRNASTSTMIPAALTTRNAPTAMAAAPSAGR